MKTPCLKCGLIHDEPTAICDGYVGIDIKEDKEDTAAVNRRKAVERIRAVLASVPVEARPSTGRPRVRAAAASASASAATPAMLLSGVAPGPVRPAIVGSAIVEPPASPPEVPEWRREVTERLESYRSRRERQRAANGQSVLAFRVHSRTGTLEDEADSEAHAAEIEAAAETSASAAVAAPTAEAERVYAPVEDGSVEAHSEQVFAAGMETSEVAPPATAETAPAAAAEAPAALAALTVPAEPPLVVADAATLEVHADPPELAEVQMPPVGQVESPITAAPILSLSKDAPVGVDPAPMPAIPAIDTDYWHSQPERPAETLTAHDDGLETADIECGTLTSGFEVGTRPPVEEEELYEEDEVAPETEPVTAGITAAPPAVPILSAASVESPVEPSFAPATEESLAGTTQAVDAAGDVIFPTPIEASEEEKEETEEERRRAALRTASRPPLPAQPERIEINVPQPVFDFAPVNLETQQPRDQALPVADLRERRCAAVLDMAILSFTVAGFFLAFRLAGGEFSFSRVGAAVGITAAFLIYAQYILLFTMAGGETPGMLLRGLRVVCFDGRPPEHVDLVWRSFGCLLSAAAGTLGFVWSAWDEHGLTWHDRISQTYITYAEPVVAEAPVAAS